MFRTVSDSTLPDVSIAAGPNHVGEIVNLSIGIFTKQGTLVSSAYLNSFFPVSISDHIGDPKLLYDSQSGRWFSSLLDITTNRVVLGVSNTSDPSDLINGWYFYDLGFTECPDQPKIGISDDKLVISANDFTNHCGDTGIPSFVGTEYQILNKSQLVAASSVSIQGFVPDASSFSITPVQDLSSTETMFMVENLFNTVRVYTISGSVPSATITSYDLSIVPSNFPPSAAQPSTSIVLDTGDNRIQDAKWSQGKIWLAFNDGCTPFGDSQSRSCIHLIQINTASSTLSQDFRISSSGYYYFYPAVGIDSFGGLDLVFGFTSSSSVRYPSIAISGQAAADTPNTIRPPQTLREGTVPDIEPVQAGFVGTRFGDYFGAALDPSAPERVWVGGEYQTLSSTFYSPSPWSTFIGSIGLPVSHVISISESLTIAESIQTLKIVGCLPPNSGDWVITTSCTLGKSAAAPANVIVQNNSVLIIPNGKSLNIDFTHNHLLVKKGSGVLIKSGAKIF